MTQSLYSVFKAEQAEPLDWTEEPETAFERIKDSLHDPPALGHPNYKSPFFFVHERRKHWES